MNFEIFMKGNAIAVEDREIIVSKRFVKDGEPVAWKIRAITSETNETLRRSSTSMVSAPGKAGKRGQMVPRVDSEQYAAAFTAECVVYPDLNDATLQDSYGVKDAVSLLRVMLTPGEMTDLQIEAQDLCGFQSLDDKVDEAKN